MWRVWLSWAVAEEVGVVEMKVEVVLLWGVALTAAGGLLAHHEPSGGGTMSCSPVRLCYFLCILTLICSSDGLLRVSWSLVTAILMRYNQ